MVSATIAITNMVPKPKMMLINVDAVTEAIMVMKLFQLKRVVNVFVKFQAITGQTRNVRLRHAIPVKTAVSALM